MSIIVRDKDGNRKKLAGIGKTGPAGPQGEEGIQGPPGVGIPTGGVEGQTLIKIGSGDYVTGWGPYPSNKNLLINSDFRRPVNRNGRTEYTSAVQTIDRWALSAETITAVVGSGGVRLKEQGSNDRARPWLSQNFENVEVFAGKTVTFSALISANTASKFRLTIRDGNIDNTVAVYRTHDKELSEGEEALISFTIKLVNGLRFAAFQLFSDGADVTVYAAKLELGPVQTLAHKEGDTWVLNDPPDYDLQYALCSQYSPTTGEWIGSQHSNPNLLDNAYWASKDAIINQRGQDEYTAEGYIIDRWYITENISVRLLDNGIILEHTSPSFIRQTLENPAALSGKTVTLSALLSDVNVNSVTELLRCRINNTFALYNTMVRRDGLCSITFTCPSDITSFHIEIGSSVSNSLVVHAIKLELGPVQTLAHKEGDTWVLNDPPPNKALELAKCQRYQLISEYNNSIFGRVEITDTRKATLFMPTPVKMRANPSIKISTLVAVGNGKDKTVNNIVANGTVVSNGIQFSVIDDFANIGAYQTLSCFCTKIEVDANL